MRGSDAPTASRPASRPPRPARRGRTSSPPTEQSHARPRGPPPAGCASSPLLLGYPIRTDRARLVQMGGPVVTATYPLVSPRSCPLRWTPSRQLDSLGYAREVMNGVRHVLIVDPDVASIMH